MSGTSNVGGAGVYEAKDQRTVPDSEKNKTERYEEGKENSHSANDPKDQRSIANRLANEEKKDDSSGKIKTKEQKLGEKDPTGPAKMHGNEPSKGAKIDAEIQAEEEAMLAKKDKKGKDSMPGKKN